MRVRWLHTSNFVVALEHARRSTHHTAGDRVRFRACVGFSIELLTQKENKMWKRRHFYLNSITKLSFDVCRRAAAGWWKWFCFSKIVLPHCRTHCCSPKTKLWQFILLRICWVTSRQSGTCHRQRNAPHDTRAFYCAAGFVWNGRHVIDVGYRDGKFDALLAIKEKTENSIFNLKNQNENCSPSLAHARSHAGRNGQNWKKSITFMSHEQQLHLLFCVPAKPLRIIYLCVYTTLRVVSFVSSLFTLRLTFSHFSTFQAANAEQRNTTESYTIRVKLVSRGCWWNIFSTFRVTLPRSFGCLQIVSARHCVVWHKNHTQNFPTKMRRSGSQGTTERERNGK